MKAADKVSVNYENLCHLLRLCRYHLGHDAHLDAYGGMVAREIGEDWWQLDAPSYAVLDQTRITKQ